MSDKIPKYLVKSYIKNKTPQDRKEFLATYNYVKYLTSNFYIHLSQTEMLSLIENDKWIDKSFINQKIINLFSTKPKNISLDINNEQIENIARECKDQSRINGLLRQNQTCEQRIRNCLTTIQQENFTIASNKKTIEFLSSGSPDIIMNVLDKAIKSSKFDHIYYNSSNKFFFFVQKNDCILHDNDVAYNFGKYMIAWKVLTTEFLMLPYENNLCYDRTYMHPHVFYNAQICWGNAAASISELSSRNEYEKIILIADQILNNWNPDSPVIHIEKQWQPVVYPYNFYDFRISPENGFVHPRYVPERYRELNCIKGIYNYDLNLISQEKEVDVNTLSSEETTETLLMTGT